MGLRKYPFSSPRSWLVISPLHRELKDERIYLRTVRGKISHLDQDIFLMGYQNKNQEFSPFIDGELFFHKCSLKNESNGTLEAVFDDYARIHFFGNNITPIFTMDGTDRYFTVPSMPENNAISINCTAHHTFYYLKVNKGSLVAKHNWNGTSANSILCKIVPDENGETAFAFGESDWSDIPQSISEKRSALIAKRDNEAKAWVSRALIRYPDTILTREALYTLWSSEVPAGGELKRPAILMSKMGMSNIWAWDHCFNALALAPFDPEKAINNLLVLFELQDSTGRIPDCINDRVSARQFVKPPVHGFFAEKIITEIEKYEPINNSILESIYNKISLWTEWWFNVMDINEDGVPCYNHGNDCGWDNSTIFSITVPVQSPDLITFLILQMEFLEKIALRIDQVSESTEWGKRHKDLLNILISKFWNGSRFVAFAGQNQEPVDSESLITYLPLLLGKRLPETITKPALKALLTVNEFNTDYGFATEKINSAVFKEDGYWRGAIWAPPTYMLYEALISLGKNKEAKAIARNFLEMCKINFGENFSALSGEVQCDRPYTWTSSVALIFSIGI